MPATTTNKARSPWHASSGALAQAGWTIKSEEVKARMTSVDQGQKNVPAAKECQVHDREGAIASILRLRQEYSEPRGARTLAPRGSFGRGQRIAQIRKTKAPPALPAGL